MRFKLITTNDISERTKKHILLALQGMVNQLKNQPSNPFKSACMFYAKNGERYPLKDNIKFISFASDLIRVLVSKPKQEIIANFEYLGLYEYGKTFAILRVYRDYIWCDQLRKFIDSDKFLTEETIIQRFIEKEF